MHINLKVAKRYSKGLYDYSIESNKQQSVYDEMILIEDLIKSSSDLIAFLSNPILEPKKKQKVADELFKSFSKESQAFVRLMIKHKREAHLLETAQSYIRHYENENKIVKVSITTATQLSQSSLESIYSKSSLVPVGSKVNLEYNVDESLIGGFILIVNDKQIDTSVKTKLQNLRSDFNVNHYISKL